jgi:regulator of sirC expression with transglutaminase-like and TPR domain
MSNQSEIRRLFAEIVNQNDEDIVLAEAALLYAKEEYPDLDIEKYIRKIDFLAEEIKKNIVLGSDPNVSISEINKYLFTVAGFRGNDEDYYDPKNSFLNDVLDRKQGIPITLSVVYLEIANRLGLNLAGVGFPGHFMVKFSGPGDEILIDPFNKGRILSEKNCQDFLSRMYGDHVRFRREMLAPSTNKQILSRMLNNLKGIYVDSKNHQKALSVVELILELNPDSVSEVRDRGLLYYELECFSQALHGLETYLNLSPDAPDHDVITNIVSRLRDVVKLIN